MRHQRSLSCSYFEAMFQANPDPWSFETSDYERAKYEHTVKVFEGRSHLLPAQRGWEEIADYALSWAEQHVVSLA